MTNLNEMNRRKEIALFALKKEMQSDDDESDVNLFVSHHLNEIPGEYWIEHLGSENPTFSAVIDLLVMRSHRGNDDENGFDSIDFTLPDDVSNYVLTVHFDEDGDVDNVAMES